MENKTSFHKFMDATSGVKVEMALIDDINSQATAVRAKLEGILKATRPLIAKSGEVERDSLAALKLIASAKQQAKALGVDIKQFIDIEDKLKNNVRVAKALQAGMMSY